MKSDVDFLAEAQALVSRAERQGRSLTEDERRSAETALKQVQAIRDRKELTRQIEDFRDSLNLGGRGFAEAVVSAGFDLKSKPSVEIPLSSAVR